MREINERGLAIIKQNEGLQLNKYTCPAGKPTIGYGHVVLPGEDLDTITETVAENLLRKDLEKTYSHLAIVLRGLSLTDNQYSALVSLVFNIGSGNFTNSTLLKKLRAGDYEGAAREFNKWVFAGKKKLPGLIKRRGAERKLFESVEVSQNGTD